MRVFSLSLCRTFHRLMDAAFKRLCNKGRESGIRTTMKRSFMIDRGQRWQQRLFFLQLKDRERDREREEERGEETRGSTAPLSTTTRGAFSLKRSMPCCSRVESAKHGSAASLPFCSLRNGSGSFPRPRLPSAWAVSGPGRVQLPPYALHGRHFARPCG